MTAINADTIRANICYVETSFSTSEDIRSMFGVDLTKTQFAATMTALAASVDAPFHTASAHFYDGDIYLGTKRFVYGAGRYDVAAANRQYKGTQFDQLDDDVAREWVAA